MALPKLHRIGIVGGGAESLVRYDFPWFAARTPAAAFPALRRALAWNHRLVGATAALAIGTERFLRPWLKIPILLLPDENTLLHAGGALELSFPLLLKEYPGLPAGSSKNLADAAEEKTAPAIFLTPPKIPSGTQSCANPGERGGLAFGPLWPLLILRRYAANFAALSFFGSAPLEPLGRRAIPSESGLGFSLSNPGSRTPEGQSSMSSGAGYDAMLQFQSQQESQRRYASYPTLDEMMLGVPPPSPRAQLQPHFRPPDIGVSPVTNPEPFSAWGLDRGVVDAGSMTRNIFIKSPMIRMYQPLAGSAVLREQPFAEEKNPPPGLFLHFHRSMRELLPQTTGSMTWRTVSFEPQNQESSERLLLSKASTLGVHPRTRLERFFPNLDLTTIRVHSDESADRVARSLRADAFTIGRSIFFRSGRFDPASPRGLALLGHELVHVQQAEQRDSQMLPPDQRKLEKEAISTERILASVFSADQGSAEGTVAFPLRQWALPLSLVHTVGIANPSSPRASREAPSSFSPPPPGGMAEASFPSRSLQPLRADESRASAREPSPASGSGGGSAAEDIENLSRRLLRTISRQIAVEKERRGVDRWAR